MMQNCGLEGEWSGSTTRYGGFDEKMRRKVSKKRSVLAPLLVFS